jgi:alpha-tubulin suppressor-like RCC1 family protein
MNGRLSRTLATVLGCGCAGIALTAVGGAGAQPAALSAKTIDGGSFVTCALTASGGAKCWGLNNEGELGNGSDADSAVPVDVAGLSSGVDAISAGTFFTCALTSAGGAKCWGDNEDGDLGNGTETQSSVPVDVAGLSSGVKAISAGGTHACVVTSAGGVKCWGDNDDGELGDGTRTDSFAPVDVVGLSSGVTAVAAGTFFTCALTDAGGVKCWGDNEDSDLGNGTEDQTSVPVDVAGLSSGVTAISVGLSHGCALTSAGGVKCWGANDVGQLGDGTEEGRSTPVNVFGLSQGIEAITAGRFHTCALSSGGGVKCWGENEDGQLGTGADADSSIPVGVSGLSSGITAITAANYHSCAVMSGGGVKCWGYNGYGELGDGTKLSRPIPVDVADVVRCGVPDVTGLKLDSARSAIVYYGCAPGKVRRVFSSKVKPGYVVSQRPAPGVTLPSGSRVDLVVSRGPGCGVPNVRRKTLRAAKQALIARGCRPGKVRLAYSTRIQRGRVISQKPAPARTVARGTAVSLVVSRGPRR